MKHPGTAAAVIPRKSLENKMPSFRTAALLAFPLALASLLAAPALAAVKAGVDASQAGHYQTASAEWRPLARKSVGAGKGVWGTADLGGRRSTRAKTHKRVG